MVQSDIENRAYQIQRILADKLDSCKERENVYMNENIKEIQELYKEEKDRTKKYKGKEKEVQDKEVFLYKPYKKVLRLSGTVHTRGESL